MDVTGPLKAKQARDLARSIERSPEGRVRILEAHNALRMKQRGVSEADVRNVIRFGIVYEDGCENGTWRYRFETRKFRVVIAFRSETTLVVITVMRLNWS